MGWVVWLTASVAAIGAALAVLAGDVHDQPLPRFFLILGTAMAAGLVVLAEAAIHEQKKLAPRGIIC